MRDSITLLFICLGIVLGFALLFYYVHRQLYKMKKDFTSLQTHVFYQQRIIEQHDRILGEKLGTPSSLQRDLPLPISSPLNVAIAGNDLPANNPSNPVFPMMSALPIAPMMGSLLNMFQQFQPESEEVDMNRDEYIQIPPITKEDIDQELCEELEELKRPDCVESEKGSQKEEEEIVSVTDSKSSPPIDKEVSFKESLVT